MIEQLRSPGGRIAIGVTASLLILAMAFAAGGSMIALAPVLLLPVWASLFADSERDARPPALKVALAAGIAAFVAAVVVYFFIAS